ncbi:MAG: iron-sulfur cluster assembly protein [Ilumatobacteraceae bacterium]
MAALDRLVRDVDDPELPHVTIGDLGIVRSVDLDGDRAIIVLTPTYSGCPATEQIRDDVAAAVIDAGFVPDVRIALQSGLVDRLDQRPRSRTTARRASLPTSGAGTGHRAGRPPGSVSAMRIAPYPAGVAVRCHRLQGELRVQHLHRAVRSVRSTLTMSTFTPLTVTSAINDPHDCLIVTFDTSEHGDRFRFAHGQHVNLRHEFDGVDVRRSYSICSAAPDGELRSRSDRCLVACSPPGRPTNSGPVRSSR